jgi:hypothetical protein
MRLKQFFAWLIFIVFLLTASFYVLINHKDTEEQRRKFQQKYGELVHTLGKKYDYQIHLANFLDFITKVNATPHVLFGNNFISSATILKEFSSEADAIMNKNEEWKSILTSPSDVFFNISKEKILDILIVFQNPEYNFPEDNKMITKFLYYNRLSYNGFTFHSLSNKPNMKLKLTSGINSENPEINNKNAFPRMVAKKNLCDFFETFGISLPLKKTSEIQSNTLMQFELSPNLLKIRIKHDNKIQIKTDSNCNLKMDSSVFLKFNSKHPFLKKADSLAGYSVLNSLRKNTDSKSVYFKYNNHLFICGTVSDPESFKTCIQYIPTHRFAENTAYVILPEKVLTSMPITKKSLILLHDESHYLITDSSGFNDGLQLLAKNLEPFLTIVRESFNETSISGIIHEEKIFELQNDTNSFKYIRKVTAQNENNNNIYVEIQVKKVNPETPDWQFQCEGKIKAGPFEFFNHNTGSGECIVQDEAKNIYILNRNDGNKMISFKVDDMMEDELFYVDMFKNKKYQMIFKSGNQIHLIDRNGKYVNAYPFKIHSKITTPLNVVIYPQSNEYRMWFGCKDKKIYSYNLFTLIPEKFEPYAMEHISMLPVKYITYRNSDYLFTIDEEGNIHAFGRKGDPRIGFKNKAIKNLSDYIVNPKNKFDEGYLMYFDHSENSIHKIYFADKKEIIRLPFPIEEVKDFTLNMTSIGTLGILTHEYFYLYDDTGKEIFKIENTIKADKCRLKNINGNYFISLINKSKKEYLLFQNTGLVLNLKNIENGQVFSAENEKDYFFIGTYDNKIMCFKIKGQP